jgi:hypothetical protein
MPRGHDDGSDAAQRLHPMKKWPDFPHGLDAPIRTVIDSSRNDRIGSWSCKNALVEALTACDYRRGGRMQ